MKSIDANTRIASLIKSHPGALDRLVSISPRFQKLRNPLMRKLLAGRATIAMAARIAGIPLNAFFDQLSPLGFVATRGAEAGEALMRPEGFKNLKEEDITELDVRPYLDNNRDPLPAILKAFRSLDSSRVLRIVNSFEPLPLISLLEKQGCSSFTELVGPDLFHTYFKKNKASGSGEAPQAATGGDWENILMQYQDGLVTIDVRGLEMPAPMMQILDHLEKLKEGQALFVYHKRVPLFLLPELSARKFGFRHKKIREGEVHLVIFREQ